MKRAALGNIDTNVEKNAPKKAKSELIDLTNEESKSDLNSSDLSSESNGNRVFVYGLSSEDEGSSDHDSESNEEEEDDDDDYDFEAYEAKAVNWTPDQIKIRDTLKEIKFFGKFSVDGEAIELPMDPKISINGYGDLTVPLTGENAESLLKICDQAPFGLNYDTLIDKTVRDTHQLHPSSIEIKNPEWNSQLKLLVNRISKELIGNGAQVEAILYKLLLYKTGGHFRKHKDTEKEKSMFGTLVIQLPSIYDGGELLVYYGDCKKVCDFGQKTNKASCSVQYAAHYADLEHELLEIKSGYRLVLIYSLCWANGGNENQFKNNVDKFMELKEPLENINSTGKPLAICLDHEYTQQSLMISGIRALKGVDNFRYGILSYANEILSSDKKFNFYLAALDLSVEYEDTKQQRLCIDGENHFAYVKQLYNLNGDFLINHELPFGFLGKILNLSARQGELDVNSVNTWDKKSSTKSQQYTGNEGILITTTYHKYALVLIPKHKEFDLLIKKMNTSMMGNKISLVYDAIKDGLTIDQNIVKIAKNLFQEELKYKNSMSYYFFTDFKFLSILFTISKVDELKDDVYQMLLDYLKLIKKSDEEMTGLIAEIIIHFSWETIKPELPTMFTSGSIKDLTSICNLVKGFYKLDTDMAYSYFKSYALPTLIEDDSKLKKLIGKDKINLYENYYSVCECMLIFEAKMEGLKSYIKFLHDKFKPVYLEKLKKDFSKIVQSSSQEDLIPQRAEWLQDQTEHVPYYKANMIVTFPECKQFEEFLQSDLTEINLEGCFKGIEEARRFKNKNEGVQKRGFSTTMTPFGSGKSSGLTIVKTPGYFKNQIQQFNAFKSEIKIIKLVFNI